MDIYELMLQKGIGISFAKTYDVIARYYEFEELDYRKADKVYREGFLNLDPSSPSVESERLADFTEQFSA